MRSDDRREFFELFERKIGNSDRADFSFVQQLLKGTRRLGERNPRIGSVQIIQIDPIGPKPPQRFFALSFNRGGATVLSLFSIVAPVDPPFCCNCNLISM